jgi:hypothetical protein
MLKWHPAVVFAGVQLQDEAYVAANIVQHDSGDDDDVLE